MPSRRRACRCGKVRYPGREAALHALHRVQGGVRSGSTRLRTEPARAYECEFCAGWHLTSQAAHG